MAKAAFKRLPAGRHDSFKCDTFPSHMSDMSRSRV